MKGFIQLWDVGPISMATKTPPKPHLLMTVAHEFGVVREIKWCPSGCWEGVRGGDGEGVRGGGGEGVRGGGGEGVRDGGGDVRGGDEDGRLLRMGLLALACSDGFARILRYV